MRSRDPLVPAHVDLSRLDGFMLDTVRLLGSELVALSTGEEFKAAVLLWCRAWKQIPACSLPNDDRILASFAGVPLGRWKKVKPMAMRGFVECVDGRFYHRVLAADALRAWEARQEYQAQREADRQRLAIWREKKRQKREAKTRTDAAGEPPHETASETRFETGMKRVSKQARKRHGNALETSKTGRDETVGKSLSPTGSSGDFPDQERSNSEFVAARGAALGLGAAPTADALTVPDALETPEFPDHRHNAQARPIGDLAAAVAARLQPQGSPK